MNGFVVFAQRKPIIAVLQSGKNAPRLQFLELAGSIDCQLPPLKTRATLAERSSPGVSPRIWT